MILKWSRPRQWEKKTCQRCCLQLQEPGPLCLVGRGSSALGQALELGEQDLQRPEKKGCPGAKMVLNSFFPHLLFTANSPPERLMLKGNYEKTIVHLTKQMFPAPVFTSFTSCHHYYVQSFHRLGRNCLGERPIPACIEHEQGEAQHASAGEDEECRQEGHAEDSAAPIQISSMVFRCT